MTHAMRRPAIMKNFSIFSRLMMGYLFLLVLAIGMSVYTIVQLGRVRDVTHTIILVDNEILDLHKSLTDDVVAETRNEKKFVIMRDPALYDQFVAARDEFDRQFERIAFLADSPALQNVLASLGEHHNRYQALFSAEAGYVKAGSTYDAKWYAAEKEAAVNALLDDLQQVRALSQLNVINKVRRLNEAGASAVNVTAVVTAVSLISGVLLSIFITRSITRPLALIRRKTAEIGSGIYEADLRLASPPEIGALAQDVNFMSTKLKEVDRLKSDFYALMSHELRTPLTSIKEGTTLMLDGAGGAVSERQKRILTIIVEESNRLIDLVTSLLDLSRLEAGMLAYHFARAEVPELVQRAVGEVSLLAEAKRIRIERDIPPSLTARMDIERVLQVLRNLLGNALKFTPAGGIVRIAAGRRGEGVWLSVSDTGPGIPQEQQATIFDKFRQAAATRAAAPAGSGLGLAIVKHIVEDHGGKAWVKSVEGKGSTFFFMLPS